MNPLTAPLLAQSVGCDVSRAIAWLPFIAETIDVYGISVNRQRLAAFLAQIGHESEGLRYTTELWGPTPAQVTYERDFNEDWPPPPLVQGDRNFKAFHLGNVNAGDGKLYRGHGLMQNTGHSNHVLMRDKLRARFGPKVPDFELEPARLGFFRWAALAAGQFWDDNKLNDMADGNDFKSMTIRINGGLTGYADRLARLEAANTTLSWA